VSLRTTLQSGKFGPHPYSAVGQKVRIEPGLPRGLVTILSAPIRGLTSFDSFPGEGESGSEWISRRMDLELKHLHDHQMRRNSTVSVVIPTHDRPQLMRRAVLSALSQEYADLEVVVVVDGPDSATETALARVSDKRLRDIVLPGPVGAARARNLGVTAAWGDWIAFLDDDGEWLPEKTTLQMKAARSSKYLYPIVGSQLIARTSRRDLVWPRPLPFKLPSEYLLARKGRSYGEDLLSTTTLLLPKDLYSQVPFQSRPKRHQDLHWMLRVIEHAGAGLEFVPKPLAVWHRAERRKA